MITVKEALELIRKHSGHLVKQSIPVADSAGFVIAENINTPLALPPFDNSAMDGFVLSAKETRDASEKNPVRFRIKGVVKAGDSPKRKLRKKETYRIMTGAMIPPGGDTILIKEEAVIERGCLMVRRPLSQGTHIRYQGEELKKRCGVLRAHSVIHPGTVGFLSSLGKKRITVFRKPQVSLIATGSELLKPGRKLERGKIYDSNSFMISAAVKEMGIVPVFVKTVADQAGILKRVIRQAFALSDIVILMGGVSVGDYDFVKTVLSDFGVRQVLWKVKQKPGKPIYFGKKKNTLVFGLPGNPASAYTCFYEYVYPAIRHLSGFRDPYLCTVTSQLLKTVKADSKRFIFLKAKSFFSDKGRKVMPLRHQGSHMLSSLHETNSFILIPPHPKPIKRGARVVTHLLPQGRFS